MSIKMQDMIDTITEIRTKELEFKQKEKQMGDRLVLSGTQVGMIIGSLRATKEVLERELPKDKVTKSTLIKLQSVLKGTELMEKELISILQHQSIGRSENELNDDIHTLTNIFASWIGKTGED